MSKKIDKGVGSSILNRNSFSSQDVKMKKLVQRLDKEFQEEIVGGTIMAVDVHVNQDGFQSPDYRQNPVAAVFFVIHNEAA